MSLLLPLGLLGLLSIAALILIYIIKPNYQQKFVSSTYVWKKSLKYKKKSLPLNRIKNIVIFICQLCILASCALLLAKPVSPVAKGGEYSEKVAIIDASASMLAKQSGDETRFERAVGEVRALAATTADKGGVLSVIVADGEPYFLAQRSQSDGVEELYDLLDGLIAPDDFKCSYGSADMDGAALLADAVLSENPACDVILYTATDYVDTKGYRVVDVSREDEWNVAVLDCAAVQDENYYTVEVQMGCFGSTRPITVHCEIDGVNNSSRSLVMKKTELFDATEQKKTVSFTPDDQIALGGEAVYSYERIYVHVEEDDSLDSDNSFHLYGGKKPKINILYVSSVPNKFFTGVLLNMRSAYKDKWDITVVDVPVEEGFVYGELFGYDFYVFEHVMPAKLPSDGVSLLVDPDKIPEGLPEGMNMRIDSTVDVDKNTTLVSGAQHALTKFVTPEDITVSRYVRLTDCEGFDTLMYCGEDPMLLVSKNKKAKFAVLPFSLNRSNLGILFDFPIFMHNFFNYFIPATVSQYAYEVGDTVVVNSRGESLNVEGPSAKYEFSEFPASFIVTRPGTYTFRQSTMTDDELIETVYASISNYESEFTKQVDALPDLHMVKRTEKTDKDLLVYIAGALFAIVCLEWFLQSREYL